MSEEGRDRFEIPKDMRSMAEAGFEQARKAFESFLSGAQQTFGWPSFMARVASGQWGHFTGFS